MGSIYEIGEKAITEEGIPVQVIKVLSKKESDPFYLVQDLNHNSFTYRTDLQKMSSSARTCDEGPSHKRRKSDFNTSRLSDSVPSAKDWSYVEIEKFGIEFNGNVSASREVAFSEFFGQEWPEKNSIKYEKIINWRWDADLACMPVEIDTASRNLFQRCQAFQLLQTEVSVEACVRSLFEIFGFHIVSEKMCVKFGCVDMVVSEAIQPSLELMKCAVEIKGSAGYSIKFREKCRDQLAAYMISLAIENIENSKTEGVPLNSNTIYGLLHIGLTPIFYKAHITPEYIDAITRCSGVVPKLEIFEYRPVLKYNDREILSLSSRSIIFKCYEAFWTLIKNT